MWLAVGLLISKDRLAPPNMVKPCSIVATQYGIKCTFAFTKFNFYVAIHFTIADIVLQDAISLRSQTQELPARLSYSSLQPQHLPQQVNQQVNPLPQQVVSLSQSAHTTSSLQPQQLNALQEQCLSRMHSLPAHTLQAPGLLPQLVDAMQGSVNLQSLQSRAVQMQNAMLIQSQQAHAVEIQSQQTRAVHVETINGGQLVNTLGAQASSLNIMQSQLAHIMHMQNFSNMQSQSGGSQSAGTNSLQPQLVQDFNSPTDIILARDSSLQPPAGSNLQVQDSGAVQNSSIPFGTQQQPQLQAQAATNTTVAELVAQVHSYARSAPNSSSAEGMQPCGSTLNPQQRTSMNTKSMGIHPDVSKKMACYQPIIIGGTRNEHAVFIQWTFPGDVGSQVSQYQIFYSVLASDDFPPE